VHLIDYARGGSNDAMTTSPLRRLFEQVVELPPAERGSKLIELCPDPLLRRQVEQLLAADALAGDTLTAAPDATQQLIGQTVGAFRIQRLLGRGGMGIVYEAEQIEPRRTVALKLMHGAWASTERLARFRREAAMLARLEHPGIARLYEVGNCDIGGQNLPFLAMELVRHARALLDYATHHGLDLRQRLELLRRVCDAVAWAHDHGVVHRDLKPSNILVDDHGQPRIVDFGIARTTDAEAAATMTGTHQLVGTPSHMSPEQLRGGLRPVDRRSDVWSLGVVAYELLTGHHPFAQPGDSLTAIARAIEESEPIRIGRHVPDLRGDPEVVVECALRKDPAERYASANELGQEIGRLLAGEPIAARRDHTLYVLRKRVARHRLFLGTAAVIVLGTVAAAVAMSLLWRTAEDARAASERNLYFSRIAQAANSFDAGRLAEMKLTLQQCQTEHRGWEWGYLKARSDDAIWHAPCATDGIEPAGERSAVAVHGLAVSPDGAMVAVAHRMGIIRLLDAQTGRLRGVLTAHRSGVTAVAFLPQAPRRLLSTSWDRTIRLWDVDAAKVLREWNNPEEVACLAIADDQSVFVVGDRRGFLRVLALDDSGLDEAWQAHRGSVSAVAFARGTRRLASGGHDLTIALWDTRTRVLERRIERSMQRGSQGMRRVLLHGAPIKGLAFDHAGEFLYSAADDGFGKMWNATTGELMFFEAFGQQLNGIAMAPDEQVLAITGTDRLHLRHAAEGRPLEPIRGHEFPIGIVAFSPDNRLVFTGAQDGGVRASERSRRSGAHELARLSQKIWGMAITDDRATFLVTDEGGNIHVFAAADLSLVRSWRAHTQRARGLGVNHDGSRIVTVADDRRVRLWDPSQATPIAESEAPARPFLRRRGGVIVVWGDAPHAQVLSGIDLAERGRCEVGADVRSAAISPSGLVAIGANDGSIGLLNSGDLRRIRTWQGHNGASVQALEFLGDDRLASAGGDHTIRVWSTADGTQQVRFEAATSVAFAMDPSGTRLFTCPMRGNPRVLLPAESRTLLELVGHEPGVLLSGIVSLGDGRFVTGDSAGVLRVWSDRSIRDR
jgi:WD40 repeat protein